MMRRTILGLMALILLASLQPAVAFELSEFELRKSIELLDQPGSEDPKDFSGVTLFTNDAGERRIFIVDNKTMSLYEYDLQGKYHRTIRGKGFNDTEGIVHLGGDRFAIVEERIAEISLVTIDATTTTIDKSAAQVIKPRLADGSPLNPDGKNLGLEGIAYDARRNVLYVVKEKNGKSLYEVQIEGTPGAATLLKDPTDAISAKLDDLAGLHFDNVTREFLVLSHESDCVTMVGLTGPCRGELKLNGKQVEGVSLSADGTDLVVVGEARQFFHYRRKPTEDTADAASPGVTGTAASDSQTGDSEEGSSFGLYVAAGLGVVAVVAVVAVVVMSQRRG